MPAKRRRYTEKSSSITTNSKRDTTLQDGANGQKIIYKKTTFSTLNSISCYDEMPYSEIDEIVSVEKDEDHNEKYFIKLRKRPYKDKKIITRNEFKKYISGDQLFNYYSKITFRQCTNKLFFVEERILRIIKCEDHDIYLVKWSSLPIKYATWEDEATEKSIEVYKMQHVLIPPHKININLNEIKLPNQEELGPVHISVVLEIIKRFIQRDSDNGVHFSLLGGVGSVMRKEVMMSITYLRETFYSNYPILFIVDEDLVPLVKAELERFLKLFCLAITYDVAEIKSIHDNGWFFPETEVTNYKGIIISYDALPFMLDLLQKTKFLLICADATSNKSKLNTLGNLLSDYIEGDTMSKPVDEKAQLKLIEDYLKISDINSLLVISLLPFFLHSPTENIFLDSYCEPSKLCEEEFIICKLSPEQRKGYDEIISNNVEMIPELNQNLIDWLNLLIDHPLFVNDFTVDNITEKNVWPFILRSGKMRILHEFIKKAIYEEKRTLIVTTNNCFFSFLQKYFQLINTQYGILQKDEKPDLNEFQFILALIEPKDAFPWSFLAVDWIFSLTSYISPIVRNADWNFVLTEGFQIKKTKIFRFFVEDTFDVYLAADSYSCFINERPHIMYHVRDTFDYPIRLLSERSKVLPFLLQISKAQQLSSSSSSSPLLINSDIEMEEDYVGDFEPCMLERAGSVMVPTTTIQIENNESKDDDDVETHFLQYTEQNQLLLSDLKVDHSDMNIDLKEDALAAVFSIISTICWGNWQLMTEKMPIKLSVGAMKNIAYLFLDYLLKNSDREYKIAQTFNSKFVSSFDQSTSKMIFESIMNYMTNFQKNSNPMNNLNSRLERIEDLMVLTIVLARCNIYNIPGDIEIPDSFIDAVPCIGWKEEDDKELLYSVYCKGYNSFGDSLKKYNHASLSCRFHALIHAYIDELPKITGYKPKVQDRRAKGSSKGKVHSSKSLVKISKKSPRSSVPVSPSPSESSLPPKPPLPTNKEILASSSSSNIIKNDIDSEKSTKISSNVMKEPENEVEPEKAKVVKADDQKRVTKEDNKKKNNKDSASSTTVTKDENGIIVSRKSGKGPKKFLIKNPKIIDNVWKEDEQKTFARLLCDFGPDLDINDFRILIPLENKTDKDIITLKTKFIEYEKTGNHDKYLLSPPPLEDLNSAFDFFQRIDQINFDEYYLEDIATAKAMKFWGMTQSTHSLVLQDVFKTKDISQLMLTVELDRIIKRKIPKEVLGKCKFRVKLKYNKNSKEKNESKSEVNSKESEVESNDEERKSDISRSNSKDDLHKNYNFPYDTVDGRKLVFPIVVSENVTIIALGNICPFPSFSTTEFIYPEGYSVKTFYRNIELSCTIRRKDQEPVFRITKPHKRPLKISTGRSPDEALSNFINSLEDDEEKNKFEFFNWRLPGHEIFGLCLPLTRRLIQSLPNANKCTNYRPFAFRTPIKEIECIAVAPQNRYSLASTSDKLNNHDEYNSDDSATEDGTYYDTTFNNKHVNKTKKRISVKNKHHSVSKLISDDSEINNKKSKINKKNDIINEPEKVEVQDNIIENVIENNNNINDIELPEKHVIIDDDDVDDVDKIIDEPIEKGKRMMKLSDFYSSENENENIDDVKPPFADLPVEDTNKNAFESPPPLPDLPNEDEDVNENTLESPPPLPDLPEEEEEAIDQSYKESNQNESNEIINNDTENYNINPPVRRRNQRKKKKSNIQDEIVYFKDESDNSTDEDTGDGEYKLPGFINHIYNNPMKSYATRSISNSRAKKVKTRNVKLYDSVSHNYDKDNDEYSAKKTKTRETSKRRHLKKRSSSDDDDDDDDFNPMKRVRVYDSVRKSSPKKETTNFNNNKNNVARKTTVVVSAKKPKINNNNNDTNTGINNNNVDIVENKEYCSNIKTRVVISAKRPKENIKSNTNNRKNINDNNDDEIEEVKPQQNKPKRKYHKKGSSSEDEYNPMKKIRLYDSVTKAPKRKTSAIIDEEEDDDDGDGNSSDKDETYKEPEENVKEKDYAYKYHVKPTRGRKPMVTRGSTSSYIKNKRRYSENESSESENENNIKNDKKEEEEFFVIEKDINDDDDSNKIDKKDLVMRPNFNSRRKHSTIGGNWIKTTKSKKQKEAYKSEDDSSPPPISSSANNGQSKDENKSRPELHFNFSSLVDRMEINAGPGNREMVFNSRDLFQHIHPYSQFDKTPNFKQELKKFGDSILDNSEEVRDLLGFNERSATGAWNRSFEKQTNK